MEKSSSPHNTSYTKEENVKGNVNIGLPILVDVSLFIHWWSLYAQSRLMQLILEIFIFIFIYNEIQDFPSL